MANKSFLIKPASNLCNMRCQYCFYEDEVQNRQHNSIGTMPLEVADLLIERTFCSVSKRDTVSFMFQGGEPTIAGLEYFNHFTRAVKAANTINVPVQYAIQTNGLSIDKHWVSFFKANRFLVGVSVDGDKVMHDYNRVDISGKGTWNRVTQAVSKLRNAGIPVNILCVVTKQTAHSPQKTYNALKKQGVGHLQFIACLDPIAQQRGQMPYSLLPIDYGHFLCGLFDLWYRDLKSRHYTSIRLFEDFVQLAAGFPPSTCATSGNCGVYYVIESDGSVYPCDFYVLDEWKMGDLQANTLDELSKSPQATTFLNQSYQRPSKCAVCRWKSLCNGGCKRDWYETDEQIQNYYCTAFQMLFEHAENRLIEIAQTVSWTRR